MSEPEIFHLQYSGGYLEMDGFGRDEGIGVVEVVESSGGIPANYVRAFGFVLSNVSDDPEIQSKALVLVIDSPTRVHLRIKFSGEVLRTQERSFEREEFGNYGFLYFLNAPPESIEWDHRHQVKLDLLVEG